MARVPIVGGEGRVVATRQDPQDRLVAVTRDHFHVEDRYPGREAQETGKRLLNRTQRSIEW